MYSGAKLLSTSTPSFFLGKSFKCPTEALTIKSLPTIFLRVLTLVGDSTINNDFFPVVRVDLAFAFDLPFDLAFDLALGLAFAFALDFNVVVPTTSPMYPRYSWQQTFFPDFDVLPFNSSCISVAETSSGEPKAEKSL
jgi:hypothetical protein